MSHVCFHLSVVPGCVLGQKCGFGTNWSLWKVNNSLLAGGPCWGGCIPNDHTHLGSMFVLGIPKRDPGSQPSFWGLENQGKEIHSPWICFNLLGTPQSCVCPCGKIQFCHQELPLTFSSELEFTGMELPGNYHFHEEIFQILIPCAMAEAGFSRVTCNSWALPSPGSEEQEIKACAVLCCNSCQGADLNYANCCLHRICHLEKVLHAKICRGKAGDEGSLGRES